MNAPSVNPLSRQILVLHKSAGHVRFALPATLANPGSAAVIEAALLRIPGVRLVRIDAGTGKMGVHFDPIACRLQQLALVLKGSLDAAAAAARPAVRGKPATAGMGELGQQLARALKQAETRVQGFLQRIQTQPAAPQAAAATVSPGKLTPLRRAFNPSLLTERSVINFANDIVAFYLIRVHWNLITQHWIKAPLQNGSAWLTVFYLTFLLVRYRKSAATTPAKALPPPAAEKAAA